MRNRPVLAGFVGACLGAMIGAPAAAEGDDLLYWCEYADGRSALIQQKPADAVCQLVSSGGDEAKGPEARSDESASERAAEINPERPRQQEREEDGSVIEFPVVSPEETLSRDELRELILLEELESERRSIEAIRTFLGGRSLASLSNESKDYYRRRLKGHIHNIRSLQQELERLE